MLLTDERPLRPFVLSVIPVLVLLVLCAVPIIYVFRLDGPSAQQGQPRAQPLIDALERYHQAEGSYPPTLDVLVPNYLAAIPKAAWRYPYCYTVCPDRSVYILTFRPGGHSDLTPKSWGYSSEKQTWKFADGGVPAYFGETTCLMPPGISFPTPTPSGS